MQLSQPMMELQQVEAVTGGRGGASFKQSTGGLSVVCPEVEAGGLTLL